MRGAGLYRDSRWSDVEGFSPLADVTDGSMLKACAPSIHLELDVEIVTLRWVDEDLEVIIEVRPGPDKLNDQASAQRR